MSAVNPDLTRIWTVMIYMAGDNNLSEECVYALTEAKESLSDETDKLAVLAQFDPSGVRTATRRYLLRYSTTLKEDADQTGWQARETDTGEPHNLLEFIRWGIAHYPARHYMVVLVGHGSGTDDDFLLQDDNPPNALNMLELRYVFDQLAADDRKIDILGMDTCLMNMAEVCYELNRASVEYLVGSEGFSPNTGWPYKEILRLLKEQVPNPNYATSRWLAETIVREYQKFYLPYINGGISIDQSILKVDKITDVKEKMFTLCRALLNELPPKDDKYNFEDPKNDALVLAHWEAQSYNGEVFVDLHDFLDRLIVRYGEINAHIAELCLRVNRAIDCLVHESRVAGAAFQFSHGVSIYFPWAVLSPGYRNLAFPKETLWLDFLQRYHERTRRPSRPEPKEGSRDEVPLPFRASVPINKGRNGKTESMRNPPINEVVIPEVGKVATHPHCPPDPKQPPTADGEGEAAASESGSTKSKPEKRTKK